MENDAVNQFLASMGKGKQEEVKAETPKVKPAAPNTDVWDKVIHTKASYLILGDVGTGKSGLAYWLMETYGAKYGLNPVVVGLPSKKLALLPKTFKSLPSPDEVANEEKAIVFVDEADIQLGIENTKAREYVTNFLSLPRQRHQILLLAFHFPRLVLARYLPFFTAFLHKRPPYLIEFASKGKGDAMYQMMMKAEERFAELVPPNFQPTDEKPQPEAVVSHTYIVAPRLRWQGIAQNPVASFWSQDLSEIWAGTDVAQTAASQPVNPCRALACIDGSELSPDIKARGVKVEDIDTPQGHRAVYIDPFTNKQWVE